MSITNCKIFIKEVKKSPQNFFIIHYSCQSLYDDNEALSPRITSIALTHYATGQAVSFSTHAIAEELRISRDEVLNNFDAIELSLLTHFYQFLRDRRDKFWVHWNMRNLTYGFEHLEHRYRALGGKDALVIPVERRLNLNDLLSERYGEDYATDPKMKSLMLLNDGIHRHFLEGKQEAEAFENKEFIRMHNSTLAKTGFISSTIKKMVSGKLRTASKGVGVMLDRLFEGRLAKGIALIGAMIGIGVSSWQTWLWATGA